MEFSELSFADAPLIKTIPPGLASKELLDIQAMHEGSAGCLTSRLYMKVLLFHIPVVCRWLYSGQKERP